MTPRLLAVSLACATLFATANLRAQVVQLTNVSPTVGLTTGGTAVTLRGVGFLQTCSLSAPPCGQNVLQVSFGGSPAASFVVVSDTTIQAVTPPHAAGPVDVRVDHVLNSPVLPGAFVFVAPPIPIFMRSALVLLLVAIAVSGMLLIQR